MSNTKKPLASTGSKLLDENVDRHVVVIEDRGEVEVPGARPLQQIVFDGARYAHVADDDKGRWIYRPL